MSSTNPVRSTLPATRTVRSGLYGVVGMVAVLTVVCWAVRVFSVIRQGDMMLSTGFEDASVYNVWKAIHGAPVYEWPDRENYCPTFYNLLFYKFYGFVIGSLGVPNDARALLVGRLLTSGFALLGAAGQFCLTLRLLRRWPGGNDPNGTGVAPAAAGERVFLAMLALICWFSTNTTAWTTVTQRPDLAGLSCAMWGMVAWVTALENHRANGTGGITPTSRPARVIPWLVAAGGCFFAAWGFKQSLVWAFAGVMLHALLSPAAWRWRALAWAGVPVGAAVLACVGGLGPVYRENTLVVMASFGFSPRIGLPLLVQTAVMWFPLWAFALGPLWALARDWRTGAMSRVTAPVGFAVLTSAAFNVVAAFKYGSSSNILLESFFFSAALAGAALVQLARGGSDRHPPWLPRVVAVGGWAGFLLLPMVQLVLYFQGRAFTQIGGLNPGGLRKLTAPDESLRREFAGWLQGVPKPLFTRDGIFVQPWHATEQRHPSFVIDFQAYEFMRRRGLMGRDAGVGDFIRAGHFRSLLLDITDTELLRAALAAGYRERPLPALFAHLPNEYGQPANDLRWLENPAAP